MNTHGFWRVSVCSPVVTVGNPKKNADAIIDMLGNLSDSDIVVFPELCVSGYTCGDLFRQQQLLDDCLAQIKRIKSIVCRNAKEQLVFVGSPVPVGNQLFNCAVALNGGRIAGIVPKQNIPNYGEFYESRWFRAANGTEPQSIIWGSETAIPFGVGLLFNYWNINVGVEICEDLWMPIPPSSYHALAGAQILVNLSASNETVSKCEYRTELVKNQSGRCVAAYAYASAGPTESTTDLVFGGHCLIAENGNVLKETTRIGDPKMPLDLERRFATVDVDVERLDTERRYLTSFGDASRQSPYNHRVIRLIMSVSKQGLNRRVNPQPFIPSDPTKLKERCAEVFGIQCAGLAKRLSGIGFPDIYIGVSGGLDSTLALLVAAKTYRTLGIDLRKIHGITMPGYGTTNRTKQQAVDLMDVLRVSQETIDIRAACLQTIKDLKHKPFGEDIYHPSVELDKYTVECFVDTLKHLDPQQRANGDLVFENVQARERTKILMSKGFVVGTGDMSELALGWCTYNGDHMSMYGVNCGIPKTLVKFLVAYVAEHEASEIDAWQGEKLREILINITKTTISPELLPPDTRGEIEQSTETVLGPYELHDFFLANFVRYGFSPQKVLFLASHAKFEGNWSQEIIKATLKTFLRRFFSQQFKRSCVPDGPKVGSVSLSPRGDWRMPSDADPQLWLEQVY